jgi:hypothetical protein
MIPQSLREILVGKCRLRVNSVVRRDRNICMTPEADLNEAGDASLERETIVRQWLLGVNRTNITLVWN